MSLVPRLCLLALLSTGVLSAADQKSQPPKRRSSSSSPTISVTAATSGFATGRKSSRRRTSTSARRAGHALHPILRAGCTVCAPSRSVLMTGQHTGHATVRGNAKVGLKPGEDHAPSPACSNRPAMPPCLLANGAWALSDTAMTPVHEGFDHSFGYLDQTHAHNYFPTFLLRDDVRVPAAQCRAQRGPLRPGRRDGASRLQRGADRRRRPCLSRAPEPARSRSSSTMPPRCPTPTTRPNRTAWRRPDQSPVRVRGVAVAGDRLRLDGRTPRPRRGPHPHRARPASVSPPTRSSFSPRTTARTRKAATTAASSTRTARCAASSAISPRAASAMPFIVRWPGRIKPGTTSEHAGYFGGFFATAAELAGTPLPAGLDSLSFLAALLGQPPGEARLSLLGILREWLRPSRAFRRLEGHTAANARRPGCALRFGHRPR